ncbi:MAG TPA: redox-sensing transcriptional repressor Rex [Acidobacteria bacterium]|nr:redox-sensing transcriptional repressor Rex [Acidobacteriota bacterium]
MATSDRFFKRALVERLVRYLHFVRPIRGSEQAVSSARLAEHAGVDESQVRKDLAAIAVRGRPRVGFRAREIRVAIETSLGLDQSYRAVVVGAGRLGSALIAYPGFARYGLEVAALIDVDPLKIGTSIGGVAVYPVERLGEVVREEGIRLGILTVPPAAAAEMARRLACAGVEAIWNFASAGLDLPEEVYVRHEHLSVGLAELAYRLSRPS